METPPPEDHSFTPPNHKLITVYLRLRIAGEPLPSSGAAYFHEIDIYGTEPAALTAGLQPVPARQGEASSWLFFTPVKTKSIKDSRRCRRVGGGIGTWHSEHAPEAVLDDKGNRVGHRQLFSYKVTGGGRSGWSMWEFSGLDQEGGERLLVLCKIHQGHAGSRRADRSAARQTRKRKGNEIDLDKIASAPVKRRLFAPSAPTPPTALKDKTDAISGAVQSYRAEAETSEGKIVANPVSVPSSEAEIEASNDTPKHLLSFLEEPHLLQQDKISAATLSSVFSFLPGPDTSQENIVGTAAESPTSLLIPEPEAISSSMTETEEPSVLSFWDEPKQDSIGAALRPLCSFSPKPADISQENVTSSTMESPASFLIPEQEASQGDMATFDSGLLLDRGVPPALEYCYNGSFTDDSCINVSGLPQCAQGAEISGPWTGYDTMPTSCSVGNAFQGGFPKYDEFDARASSSSNGYDTAVSCSDSNTFMSPLPTYSDWAISGSGGMQYGCRVPFFLSPVPSQWCGGPASWSC